MAVILIADDDLKIRKLEDIYLRSEGFETLQAKDGKDVLSILENKKVDIIIADILMPNMNGEELVRTLRDHHIEIPVLMVTSVSEFSNKKLLFEVGADDYMTKPVDLEELVLRIRAILRRCNNSHEKQLRSGDIVLDSPSLEIRMPEKTLMLPQKEFHLLFLLLSYPGKIFTRQELMDQVWGFDTQTTLRTIDVHINRLRDRLAQLEEFDIITVRQLGYKATIKECKK